MPYQHAQVPRTGSSPFHRRRTARPDNPIIPFIEGDGTGRTSARLGARPRRAVEKAYRGKRKIVWMEVFAGEKSFTASGLAT